MDRCFSRFRFLSERLVSYPSGFRLSKLFSHELQKFIALLTFCENMI